MTVSSSFLDPAIFNTTIKFAILLILAFYAIFALVIVRQVDLMSKTLITPVSPLLKAVSIVHAGFAVGFAVLGVGLL